MPGLLVAGTTSDAGKTVVTTGLCRALVRRGVRVAPFKAQNMSNNSMVCADPARPGVGAEVGRAQWVQARAARVEPEPAMNPVLLKPGGDRASHVVVMGHPGGTVSSSDWATGRRHLRDAAFAALEDLASRHDVVVAEGAGSPTEINLRRSDYVNMGLARHAGLPTVVVGDVDRGGVLAAFHGTVALLEAADQALVAGFVVNKFRGDASLLAPGTAELARLTGRPTYGVLPWHPGLWLDSEDALDLEGRRSRDPHGEALRVAVVRLPRISNFTDVDALGLEPGVDVTFVSDPRGLRGADLVVLPGTRATVADLAWLRERGLDEAVRAHAAAGRPVLGICGGFQLLGREVRDPVGVEGAPGTVVPGLGLLDVVTDFAADKVLRLPRGSALGQQVTGYEIHHGRVTRGEGAEEFLGGARAGSVCGTLWHGSLESDGFREAFLAWAAAAAGAAYVPGGVRFEAAREARLDLLGDLVEEHLDVDALLDLALSGAPAGLPLLEPGASRGSARGGASCDPCAVASGPHDATGGAGGGSGGVSCDPRAVASGPHDATGGAGGGRARQGRAPRVLVLGGTGEARELARQLVDDGVDVVSSLAGRVARPRLPVGDVRLGGFGGVEGLRAHLREEAYAGVVDATHPFAAGITEHAARACAEEGVALLRLARPGWREEPGAARWHWVDDHDEAAAAAARLGRRPLLTIGRQSLARFVEPLRDHDVLARVVDPPEGELPRGWRLLLDRGPYTRDGERGLLLGHGADVLVTKDSGGDHTRAKLDAADELGIGVVVVRRPTDPTGVRCVPDVAAAREWVLTVLQESPVDR
nr:cobyric acid synthase [Nocardioides perillae]